MGTSLNLNESPREDNNAQSVMLKRDNKPICCTRCVDLPIKTNALWEILDFQPKEQYVKLDLPRCQLYLDPRKTTQRKEWGIFTDWLRRHKMAAIVESNSCDFYILPPNQGHEPPFVEVCYKIKSSRLTSDSEVQTCDGLLKPKSFICASPKITKRDNSKHHNIHSHARNITRGEHTGESTCQSHPVTILDDPDQKIHLNTNPSYLNTLGQTHAWAFGAIAELVDNSRDARATRLDIFVEPLYLKRVEKQVHVLAIVDDGHGMSHNEIVRMLSLGHKQPGEDDIDYIGRFGVGFKTGAMKLGKDNMEIPIITYCRHGNYMDVDLNVQSETCASKYLNAIKEFTPFNEYFIGEKFKLFDERGAGSGTQIYIWNLDRWGAYHTLEWVDPKTSESTCDQSNSDILIRSRRLRSRPGQISREVPLDYSLHAYLEVIFLDPRMKIYVQGSLVKSRPLAKSLSKTTTVKGHVMGKPIQLTLGRCHKEWERVNCGIFLYWHGRLIEAYKRVGGMVHNADMGRGVIGVADVSNIMDDGKGHVWVMNTKQGFQDCEAYARLEEWLGNRTDEYWDENFDALDLKKRSETDKPDHEWVQCNKCRKWRILSVDFDTKSLPEEWFCYMPPFSGKCESPEQQLEPGVVTVSAKRSRSKMEQVTVQYELAEVPNSNSSPSGSNNQTCTSSGCKRQANPRITNAHEKREQTVNSSMPNQKNTRKGYDSRRNSPKDNEEEWTTDVESIIQPNLKRLRKGFRGNLNKADP